MRTAHLLRPEGYFRLPAVLRLPLRQTNNDDEKWMGYCIGVEDRGAASYASKRSRTSAGACAANSAAS